MGVRGVNKFGMVGWGASVGVGIDMQAGPVVKAARDMRVLAMIAGKV